MWHGPGLGYDQAWQNVSGSRAYGVPYTNSTGKPIDVMIFYGTGCNTSDALYASINGGASMQVGYVALPSGCAFSVGTIPIPTGSTYQMSSMRGGFVAWYELR